MIDLTAAFEVIADHRDERAPGAILFHRNVGGIGMLHAVDSLECWCCPQIVWCDDERPSGEILAALAIAERLH